MFLLVAYSSHWAVAAASAVPHRAHHALSGLIVVFVLVGGKLAVVLFQVLSVDENLDRVLLWRGVQQFMECHLYLFLPPRKGLFRWWAVLSRRVLSRSVWRLGDYGTSRLGRYPSR